jgi:hypothetical protein
MPLSDADQELMELQRSAHTQGVTAGQPAGAAVQSDPAIINTFELRRAAQREAYGQFVAAGPIHYGGAPIFNTGQPVPLEHVIARGLEEQELVYRVATAEMARAGQVYSDEEFAKANPHAPRRQRMAPELHPSALDPRGGAAALDDARKAGKTTELPADPAERDAVAADVMVDLRDNPPDDDKPARGGSRGKSAGKAE